MEVIYAYTRAQALSDGVLVDVTETAKEAGIRYPTAVTCAVWQQYVRVPEEVPWQDERGRLWDVLWSAIRWPETRLSTAGRMGRRE